MRLSTTLLLAAALLPLAAPLALLGKVLPGVRAQAKQRLLDAVAAGADEEAVLKLFQACEAANPTGGVGGRTLTSPLLNGDWRLVWTTSRSIAGATRPRALRPAEAPLQFLDNVNLRAKNEELVRPLGGLLPGFTYSVEAALEPKASGRGARVQFEKFYFFGKLFGVKAPEGFRGELDTTYLDEELRLSRGDKGNTFILVRDGDARAQALWTAFQKTL